MTRSTPCTGCKSAIDDRTELLLDRGARKVTPDLGWPLYLVAVDEIAYYSATVGSKAQQNEFSACNRDVVARGRAPGIIPVEATQRPSADIMPTSLRDLFGYRWAFRCSTDASSDTILGHGTANSGYTATDIPDDSPGVGLAPRRRHPPPAPGQVRVPDHRGHHHPRRARPPPFARPPPDDHSLPDPSRSRPHPAHHRVRAESATTSTSGNTSTSASTGGCLHPVRLAGRTVAVDLTTGELRPVFDTSGLPGGVIRTACGNRRESVCPSCSQVFKRDARQLVRAGLSGGKGVPETVAQHPCVFATLTAPSFGPVHCRRMRGRTVLPCRPRRDASKRVCPHGRDISCPRRHGDHDPLLGRALCIDCYDYTAAVLFNAHAGELWRRFTVYLPRCLARRAGPHPERLPRAGPSPLRQGRRIPGPRRRPLPRRHPPRRRRRDDYRRRPAGSPPTGSPAITARCRRSLHHHPARLARPAFRCCGCGSAADRHPRRPPARTLTERAVGNYIAKYATKTLTAPGLPDRPVRTRVDINVLRARATTSHDARRLAAQSRRLQTRRPLRPVGRTCSATAATASPSPALLGHLRPAPPRPR